MCCVAIVAGVSYERAFVAVFPSKPPRQFWTTSRKLAAALKRFGIKCDRRARPLFGVNYCTLEHDAILVADKNPITWCWHWVVFDWRRKRVIDPAKKPRKRWRITSYLAIYRD